jgi:8-oxo-dGTP pyrophosphatase MutT (NUDIX family)
MNEMSMRKIINLIESRDDDDEHFKQLKKTGFFGAQGAGCIFFAKDTGRFLLAHRASEYVEQPNTFGVWGGAIDSGENPATAAEREAYEEAGYDGNIRMVPMYIFKAVKDGKIVFKYYNFLAIVEHEFTPQLNWESQGFKWCQFGQWPHPLHFGVEKLLSDSKSKKFMESMANSSRENPLERS